MRRFEVRFADGHTTVKEAIDGARAKADAKADRVKEHGPMERTDPRYKVAHVEDLSALEQATRDAAAGGR